MRLLILTQKVDKNDPVLGFFHRWVEEFAKNLDQVIVVCLQMGEYDLPENVKVLSLGKEEGKSKAEYLSDFYRYIWYERKNYDAVFVHMNPEYVVLGGLLWKLSGKKIVLWYIHKQVTLMLRVAEKLADAVLTASKESFCIKSNKVRYVGHGINTDIFKVSDRDQTSHTLLSVGRITSIKNCHVLLDSISLLVEKDSRWRAVFIGDQVTEYDKVYKNKLEDKIKENGMSSNVQFVGPLTPIEVKDRFSKAFASVNMTPTGGMDKVVLESLAAGCPVFTSNTAFQNLFGEHSATFIFSFGDASDLAQKINRFDASSDKMTIINQLSEKVRKEYGIDSVVSKVLNSLST